MRCLSSSCSNARCIPRGFPPPQPKQGLSGLGSSFIFWSGCGNHFAAQNRHSLPGKNHTVTLAASAHEAASRGCLVAEQVVASQPLLPEGTEAAVRRTGHWILVNACGGCEEA